MIWVRLNRSYHPRMCVMNALCGNVEKHSPFDIDREDYIEKRQNIHLD